MPDSRLRLLVVDDEPSLRESFTLVFHRLGYDVRSAEDGFAALFEIGKLIPDILLCDLNMPGMSGFELLSVVRRRFPAIPVIAMSGGFFGSAVPSGVAADAFYQKGSGIDHLLRTITAFSKMERLPRIEALCGFCKTDVTPPEIPPSPLPARSACEPFPTRSEAQ
jgi:CheY-like chemotaxis protein